MCNISLKYLKSHVIYEFSNNKRQKNLKMEF